MLKYLLLLIFPAILLIIYIQQGQATYSNQLQISPEQQIYVDRALSVIGEENIDKKDYAVSFIKINENLDLEDPYCEIYTIKLQFYDYFGMPDRYKIVSQGCKNGYSIAGNGYLGVNLPIWTGIIYMSGLSIYFLSSFIKGMQRRKANSSK